jgi:hypothetical protein
VAPIIVLSCVLALACSLGASPALAQASRIAIEVRGDESGEACLTSEQLGARIAFYGTRKTLPRGMRLVLRLSAPDVAELQILRDGQVVSRRRFEHLPGPCADRRDAVALSVALALEHAAASTEPAAESGASSSAISGVVGTQTGSGEGVSAPEPEPAEPEPDSRTQPAEQVTQPARVQPEDTRPIVLGTMPTTTSRDPRRGEERPSLFQLHLGGRFVLEALPFAVWGGALGLELALSKRLSLDVSAVLSSIGEAPLADAYARASLLGLEAVGCASFPLGVFMLQACGGASVALCEVSGRDFPRARPDATLLWAAGLARIALRWPQSSSVALRLFVQPHISVSRPDLRVEGSGERLRTGWVGGQAGLDLWLALP